MSDYLRFVALMFVLVVCTLIGLYALGFHVVRAPTADQLYGCTVAEQAPNGECK